MPALLRSKGIMKNLFIESMIALSVCWLIMFAIAQFAILDQKQAYKAIVGAPFSRLVASVRE